ncbi:MAG: HYExAFE family protein [Gemmataceae bacterium]
MDRSNHYEQAFEAFLRQRRMCYIAVDESKRSLLDEGSVKSLDFIVYGGEESRFLIDVKGRRFPGGKADKPRKVWQNWATLEDIEGLERWGRRFGSGYTGLIVFVYGIEPTVQLAADTDDLFEWHGGQYLLRAVPVDVYRAVMRPRSAKWRTVHLSVPVFRDVARPFTAFAQSAACLL